MNASMVKKTREEQVREIVDVLWNRFEEIKPEEINRGCTKTADTERSEPEK